MKNRLFWRLFWAFLATLILTVSVLSVLMVYMVRAERQETLEGELFVQARDASLLMRQQEITYRLWRGNITLTPIVEEKIQEIRTLYGADVWIVNATGSVLILGDAQTSADHLNDEDVISQLRSVLSGQEIRVKGLIPQLGSDVVTIGVPLSSNQGYVYGALLLHIDTDHLKADYSDMIRNALIAGIIAMGMGSVLAYSIAKKQTGPIRHIQEVVQDFSKGNLDRRVNVKGNDEMAQLGDSINRMVTELGNLDRSRRSFVANVSHELRSPLTCMSGYVQGMLDGTIDDGERNKYLSVVYSETQRLTKLVNELLDLSRFESGKIPLTLTTFDLNQLIALELFKFEGRIDEKSIEVEVHFHEETCFVSADCDRIRQVVTNLVDNAVKFLRDNGHLIVDTRTDGDKAVVTISNDGPQIPPSDLPYVFDRFYKADKAHTSGKGTGLGLSITKLIITQHNQMIRADSGPALTTFTFTLQKADPPGRIEGAKA